MLECAQSGNSTCDHAEDRYPTADSDLVCALTLVEAILDAHTTPRIALIFSKRTYSDIVKRIALDIMNARHADNAWRYEFAIGGLEVERLRALPAPDLGKFAEIDQSVLAHYLSKLTIWTTSLQRSQATG